MGARLPLVVILGATGTGKTRLSLELAQKFGGEIVGADSMQIYKDLDVITAKASKQERELVPHHLIDILEPYEHFTVVDYKNRALSIIDGLFQENKLPIIVGGTNYYIESLLWNFLLDDKNNQNSKNLPGLLPNDEHLLPSEELHAKLQLLDSEMAKRLHPKNKRKILRSLEIFYQKNRKHSEMLDEQHSQTGGSKTSGELRYKNALILQLQCSQDILDERLNNRVDEMMENGLIEELERFHLNYNKNRHADYTRGIFQTIGFKEFHPYLILNDEEKSQLDTTKLFDNCVENMKIATRRYARKQYKWIKNRVLGRPDREIPPMYGLDATDPDAWDARVSAPALDIVSSCITQTPCNYSGLLQKSASISTSNAEDETFFCEICERVFVGVHQWCIHQKSGRHKKMLAWKNRTTQHVS